MEVGLENLACENLEVHAEYLADGRYWRHAFHVAASLLFRVSICFLTKFMHQFLGVDGFVKSYECHFAALASTMLCGGRCMKAQYEPQGVSNLIAWKRRALPEPGLRPSTSFLIWVSMSSSSPSDSPSSSPCPEDSTLWRYHGLEQSGNFYYFSERRTCEKISSTSAMHFGSLPKSQVTNTPQSPVSMVTLLPLDFCHDTPPYTVY